QRICEVARRGKPHHRGRGKRRRGTGGSAGCELEGARRFQREKNRDAAARQHAGHFVSRVAHVGWIKNYAAWRRRASAADAKSRSAFAFSAEENRRCMDG